MKIINYKTGSVGWIIAYNEGKVDVGNAVVIGGNISTSRDKEYLRNQVDIKNSLKYDGPYKQLKLEFKDDDKRILKNDSGTKVILREEVLVIKRDLERIFNHYSKKNKHGLLKNRFIHLKLTVSPKDELTNRTFRILAERVLEGLGLSECPYLIYRHFDTEHPHCHLVISRVDFSGNLVRDSFDGLKMKRLEADLESEFELTKSAKRLISDAGVRLPQKWELERMLGEGLEEISKGGYRSARNYVQTAIIESFAGHPNMEVFVKRLERRGVEIWHKETERNGLKYHGISYTLKPELIKAQFESRDFDASISGIKNDKVLEIAAQTEPVNLDKNLFGDLTGRIQINSRGVPETTPVNSRVQNELKPFSFRASNLGPLFQWSSILQNLESIDSEVLGRITVKARRKKEDVNEVYKREALTNAESQLISSLALASEIRSNSRVAEILKKGASSEELSSLDRAVLPEEIEFIKRVIRDQEKQDSKRVTIESEEDEIQKTFSWYRRFTGRVPNEATAIVLSLAGRKDFTAIANMYGDLMKSNHTNKSVLPDRELEYLPGLPAHLSQKFNDFNQYLNSIESQTFITEESKNRQKQIKDTEELAKAMEAMDSEKAWTILRNGNPDVSKLPIQLLTNTSDSDLIRELKLRAKIKDPIPRSQSNKAQNDIESGADPTLDKSKDKQQGPGFP